MTNVDVMFTPGQVVQFGGSSAIVADSDVLDGEVRYLVESGPVRLPMWVPASVLEEHQRTDGLLFSTSIPHVVAKDNFFNNPDEIRRIALAQDYVEDLRRYKGFRSTQRFLWPGLAEEFGRLIGQPVRNWLNLDMNGRFQQTSHLDPLVWHHDTQSYAAAIYLTPDAPPQSGTSFWRDRSYGCRRRPDHMFEKERLEAGDEAVLKARAVVYDQYNLLHGDNWELMESIAGLYNRLVIFDASLFHSATCYDHFNEEATAPTRLVQLFFFDI